jgi:hypothetical protein
MLLLTLQIEPICCVFFCSAAVFTICASIGSGIVHLPLTSTVPGANRGHSRRKCLLDEVFAGEDAQQFDAKSMGAGAPVAAPSYTPPPRRFSHLRAGLAIDLESQDH